MIYSVKGKLIGSGENFIVVECGGIGYRVYTSQNTKNKLPNIGSEVLLYTYLSVREDAMELYGFSEMRELECFRMLIGVSGIGTKMAISVLSVLSAENFALAVTTSDVNAISKAQGVGRKKAERIVLELKDKIKIFDDILPSGKVLLDGTTPTVSTSNIAKATEALTVLGYTSGEVMPILAKMDTTLPVEKLISGVLREMGRR